MQETQAFVATSVVLNYLSSARPGLKALAKRYQPLSRSSSVNTGLTLVFAHCADSHKEAWEPVVQAIFERDRQTGRPPVVREAWSVEWPNHGESASVNASVLSNGPPGISVAEWALALQHFVVSKATEGHRLVGIGHSGGVCAIIRSTMSLPQGVAIPYVSIINIEDVFVTRGAWNSQRKLLERSLFAVRKSIENRRDTWASRGDAADFISGRMPWKLWDKRVLDLFLEYGLRDITAPGLTSHTVTLACSKQDEMAVYSDPSGEQERYREAEDHLVALDASLPVHFIYGEREDVIPHVYHSMVIASRPMASVHQVPTVGHLAIQENPDAVAHCLATILGNMIPYPLKAGVSRL